ncbi:MAG: hypothetical protein FWB80_14905 [Defluviitaleaceae bacterium]|nr:hypothetical protein [Defluviitaleaceae bacterium]
MDNLPKIDPEFKSLIPPLSPDEREQLEQNILSHGCHNALVLWRGIIIDGHNRFEICAKHFIEFEITEIDLPNRESVKLWILNEQLGRRNLNDATRIEIALAKSEMIRELAKQKQILGGRVKSRADKLPPKTSNGMETRDVLAAEADVSHGTLQNYQQIKKESPELYKRVKAGELKIGTAFKMLESQAAKHLPQQSEEDLAEIHARLNALKPLLNKLSIKLERIKTC